MGALGTRSSRKRYRVGKPMMNTTETMQLFRMVRNHGIREVAATLHLIVSDNMPNETAVLSRLDHIATWGPGLVSTPYERKPVQNARYFSAPSHAEAAETPCIPERLGIDKHGGAFATQQQKDDAS